MKRICLTTLVSLLFLSHVYGQEWSSTQSDITYELLKQIPTLTEIYSESVEKLSDFSGNVDDIDKNYVRTTLLPSLFYRYEDRKISEMYKRSCGYGGALSNYFKQLSDPNFRGQGAKEKAVTQLMFVTNVDLTLPVDKVMKAGPFIKSYRLPNQFDLWMDYIYPGIRFKPKHRPDELDVDIIIYQIAPDQNEPFLKLGDVLVYVRKWGRFF